MNRRHRVVEVFSRSGQVTHLGSGYAIADDLVLTAGHAVAEDGVTVRLLDGASVDAEVAWLGKGVGDAAVLWVPSAPWRGRPDSGALRWGKVTGDASVSCRAYGFPRAQAGDVEVLEGTVNAGGAIRSERYDVDIDKPALLPLPGDDSGWRGMSGAALFGPGLQLLGVILADPKMYGSRRLQVLPAARLLADDGFATRVGAGLHDLEDVDARGEIAYLDTYVRPAYLPRPPDMPDPDLLKAKYGIVPFLGREAEHRQLLDWCHGAERFSVAVITGDGGAGKTRLAAELCRTMTEAGWQAGFADEDTFNDARDVELIWPTVLVIDYPDRMTDTVVRLVGRLSRPRRGPRLRVLLVDRAPGGLTEQLTWWRKLNRETNRLVQTSTRLPVRLEGGQVDLRDRQRHATAAWTAFTGGTTVMPDLDLTDHGYANPLKLHMAVLQAARGEVHPDADSVVASFLGREERRWVDRLPRHFIADLTDLRAHQAVTLATMTAPTPAAAVQLLTALPGLADPVGFAIERRTRITEWLAELFPGEDRIAPLTPDLLAEELLARTPGLDVLVRGIHDHETSTTVHKARMLDALRLAADRSEVRTALGRLLAERLPALIAAAETDSFLARQIDSVIPLSADDLRAASAAALGNRRYTGDKDLAQLYGRLAELAVAWHDTQPPSLRGADARTDLVAYRAVLGTVAIQDAERAWHDYESLGASPDRLAKAAYNLGTCLGKSGQPERAREWLTRAAQLYATMSGHTQAKIEAWTNLAVARADLRDQRGALEASLAAIKVQGEIPGNYFLLRTAEPLDILVKSLAAKPAGGKLLDSAPDAYYPPVGTDQTWWPTSNPTLTTLPLTRLVARIVPGLADSIPDKLRNALIPVLFTRFAKQQAGYAAQDYSEFLRALADDLLRHRLYEEASAPLRESVSLLNRFASTDPYYRKRLAEGLDQLALFSWMAKKFDEASQYAKDSIAVYRDILATDPGAIEPKVAGLYNRLAENLTEAQRIPEAIAAQREAIAIYRRLPDQRTDLAESCLDLGSLLSARGDSAEAATLLGEAAALFADLRATDPKFGMQQSDALALLGSLPADPEQVVTAAEQAVELKRDLMATGQASLIEYVDALIGFSTALGTAGWTEDAHRQALQAVGLARELTEETAEHALALGMALNLVARWALALGRYDEAATTAPKSLAAIASAPEAEPLARIVRADVLSTLSACTVADNRPEEALPLASEAVELYDALRRSGETHAGIDLVHAGALLGVGQSHMLTGRFTEGLEAAVTARRVIESSTVDSPLVQRTMAVALLLEGGCLTGLGRPAEALTVLTTANDLLGLFDADQSVNIVLRVDAIISLTATHLALGELRPAAERAGEALAALDELTDHQGQRGEVARASTLRATAMIQLGDVQGAYEASSTALDIYQDTPPRGLLGRTMLAMALATAAASANALGDRAESVARYAESVAVYREVLELNPDALISLAGVLADYGIVLFGLGEVEAAAAATGEAIDGIRGSGALEQPPVVAFYTVVLTVHAQCLLHLGEAVGEVIDEAVGLLRGMADSRLQLAQALGIQAVGRNIAGAPGVIESAGESIRIYREFDDSPEVLAATASLLGLLGQHLATPDRFPEAVDALRESVARFAAVPDPPLPLVFEHIDAARHLTFFLINLGDYPEAAGRASAALDLMRPLAGEHADLVPLIVEMLEVRGDVLADLNRHDEAAQARAEARQWQARQ